jgi:hypothetical protein
MQVLDEDVPALLQKFFSCGHIIHWKGCLVHIETLVSIRAAEPEEPQNFSGVGTEIFCPALTGSDYGSGFFDQNNKQPSIFKKKFEVNFKSYFDTPTKSG